MDLGTTFLDKKISKAYWPIVLFLLLGSHNEGIADTQLNGFGSCVKTDDGRPVCRELSTGKLKFVTQQFYDQYLSMSSLYTPEQSELTDFQGEIGN